MSTLLILNRSNSLPSSDFTLGTTRLEFGIGEREILIFILFVNGDPSSYLLKKRENTKKTQKV